MNLLHRINDALEKIDKSHKILERNDNKRDFAVNGTLDEKISLEREFADLMDTGVSHINKDNASKYVHIIYSFYPSSNLKVPIENAYALAREAYIKNDEKGSWFMKPEVPAEVVPEKIKSDSRNNGMSVSTDWYIKKENIRIFGFTYTAFADLFNVNGYYMTIFDARLIDKDTGIDLGTINVECEKNICSGIERSPEKKYVVREKNDLEKRRKEEEKEKLLYRQLHQKYAQCK